MRHCFLEHPHITIHHIDSKTEMQTDQHVHTLARALTHTHTYTHTHIYIHTHTMVI
jgi:hypothetical protein